MAPTCPSDDPLRRARELFANRDWHGAESALDGTPTDQEYTNRQSAVLLRAQCAASWSTELPLKLKSNHPAHVLDKIRRAQEARGSAQIGSTSVFAKGAGSGSSPNPLLQSKDDITPGKHDDEDFTPTGPVLPLDQEKTSSWMIDSTATPELQYWDLTMLGAIAYVAIMTPYEVAFLEPEMNALFVINRLLDAIFLSDMILQFFITAKDEKGNHIKNLSQLREMYMKGWFIIDFVSILPFDVMGLLVDGLSEFKVIRAIRVLRLFKLLRLIRTSRIMQRWENHYSINYALVGLINYMIFTLLATHWFACLYHLIAYIQGIGTDTWIDQQDVEVDGNGQVYVLSISWAAQTISSIGYGDSLATTTTERVMVILMMLMGSCIFAFALGEIGYAVGQMSVKEEHYHMIIDSVNTFNQEIDLPNETQIQCRLYVKHKHETNTLKAIDGTLEQLSKKLREEVAMHTHSGWVHNVDFFKGCPAGFVVTIAGKMKVATYTAKEIIYCSGDVVHNMFVVNKGLVAKSGAIYGAGKLIGTEMTHRMLYRPVMYAENARALSIADLFKLSWEEFRDCLEDYPLVFPQVKKIAVKAVFQKHVLAFTTACRNYASNKMNQSNDVVVQMMESELKRKREQRQQELKGVKELKVQSTVFVRKSVKEKLAEINKTMHSLDKQMTASEVGGLVITKSFLA